MPMFSAMARTTVGPAPLNRPTIPSVFTILTCAYRTCTCETLNSSKALALQSIPAAPILTQVCRQLALSKRPLR